MAEYLPSRISIMATTDLCMDARWTYPLVKVEGMYLRTMKCIRNVSEAETLRTMKSRQIREDDIFLCTYPKSDPHGSIFQHVKAWGNVSNVHKGFKIGSVQYEDMKQDCVAQVRQIAEYLDCPLPEATYQEIADSCSFENLKNACEKKRDLTYHNLWQNGFSGYFRKVQPGDLKNWFTLAQREEFDRKYKLEMTKTA